MCALGLLFSLAGCEPQVTCETDWCGTAVIVSGAEAGTLLPPVTGFDVDIALSDLLFLRLADVDSTLNPNGDDNFVPLLAQSWERTDPRTLVFTLHPDAQWHDGTPVTAADIAFTFELYRDDRVGSFTTSRLEKIESVTPRDDRTAVFRFTQVYPEQLFDATYHMRIVPRHLLTSIPRDELRTHQFGRNPVGNGPFRFVRWDAGQEIELVADSTFFLGRPGVPRVIWRFAAGPGAAVTQLLAGEADVLNFLGSPENVARVEQNPDYRVLRPTPMNYGYLGFNLRDPGDSMQVHPLFDNAEVRRAISMALDRDGIITGALGGNGTVPLGPVTEPLWIWEPDFAHLAFDQAAASQGLADAGWEDGDGDGTLDRRGETLAFELLVPNSSVPRTRSAVIIKEELAQVGIEVTIRELEFRTYLAAIESGEFDAQIGAWVQDPSPVGLRELWASPGFGAGNYGKYTNQQVEALIDEAAVTLDTAAARLMWRDAIERINEDAPAVWLYSAVMTAGVHERFTNAWMRPDMWWATLWTWRVDQSRLLARDVATP
jgi:peptide/nickel transport system substrate-binding protein